MITIMSSTFVLLALLMLSSCQTYQPPGNDLWLTVH
jgi:hypothetical protein